MAWSQLTAHCLPKHKPDMKALPKVGLSLHWHVDFYCHCDDDIKYDEYMLLDLITLCILFDNLLLYVEWVTDWNLHRVYPLCPLHAGINSCWRNRDHLWRFSRRWTQRPSRVPSSCRNVQQTNVSLWYCMVGAAFCHLTVCPSSIRSRWTATYFFHDLNINRRHSRWLSPGDMLPLF